MGKRNRRRGINPPTLPDQPPIPQARPSRRVSVSFRYTEPRGKFCLNQCGRHEVKGYESCLQKLTDRTWAEILETGGKHKKTGLAYTKYRDSDLHKVRRPSDLSKELAISAVRASEKARLFGVYVYDEGVYYVLWFDRNHEIVPC
jgi:hypothetical protein